MTLRQRTVLLGLFLSARLASAGTSFGDAGDYLRYGAGARALGMGGAYTAVSGETTSEYWNPAALAFLDEYQFTTMYAPFPFDTKLYYAAVGLPLGPWGTVAASDFMLRSDDFQARNNLNFGSGGGSVVQNALSLSYARSFHDFWSLGGRTRFLQQKVLSDSGNAIGLDLSAFAKLPRGISLGLTTNNLNRPKINLGSDADEFRPATRMGVAYTAPWDRVVAALDLNKTSGQSLYASAGLEFSPIPLLSLRAGWDQNDTITAGLGVTLRSFKVDYAFSTQTDRDDLSKVSLTWRWGNAYQAKIAPEGIVKETEAIYVEGLRNEVKFHTDVPRYKIVSWALLIGDGEGRPVRSLREQASPPAVVLWDMTDSGGKPVKRGVYRYAFRVEYKNGKVWEERGRFRLDYKTNSVGGVDMDVKGETPPDSVAPAPPQDLAPVAPSVPLEISPEATNAQSAPEAGAAPDAGPPAEPSVMPQ